MDDQLSWTKFYNESVNRKSIPKKISEFNRLVAYTDNFFVVSGYGAFKHGYFLIISKDFLPSFGLIEENHHSELKFLIKIIRKLINQEFESNSVVFEHGMCACIGGLDRAHIHIMSISKNSDEKSIRNAIDKTLYNRKVGIEYIQYNNYKLQNLHDINQIYEDVISKKNNDNIKVVGRIYSIKDIQNLEIDKWPTITLNHIQKGGHYVYFKSDYDNASFLTTNNFQTQFGREVVYQNELIKDDDFKDQVEKLIKKNKHLNVWQWQNYYFEKNILHSMKIAESGLKNLEEKYKEDYRKFNFIIV